MQKTNLPPITVFKSMFFRLCGCKRHQIPFYFVFERHKATLFGLYYKGAFLSRASWQRPALTKVSHLFLASDVSHSPCRLHKNTWRSAGIPFCQLSSFHLLKVDHNDWLGRAMISFFAGALCSCKRCENARNKYQELTLNQTCLLGFSVTTDIDFWIVIWERLAGLQVLFGCLL